LKVDGGAKFLQLQIGYEPNKLEAFIEACRSNGVTRDAAILPTVILTKTAGALRFMEGNVPGIHVPSDVIDRVADAEDPAEESYQLVREQTEHALSLAGVAGIHITDFRHDDTLRRLVTDLQIGPEFATGANPSIHQTA